MSVSRSARRWCSSWTTGSEQCLWRLTGHQRFRAPAYSSAASAPLRSHPSLRPGSQMGLEWSLKHDVHLRRGCRNFSGSSVASHNHLQPPKPGEELHVTFIDKDGDEHTFEVADGDNLLDIAQDNDIEMEGACGGSCACSTCHVIVENEDLYDKMDEPDDDENDMLDLAFGLTETSRLGCQVKMRPDLDGLRVTLPAMTRNLQASDFSK